MAIRALWEVSGIKGDRVPGMTGVWAGGVKVCAIGVGARRWVAYHGLALNVAVDLLPFSAIVPCGIGDRPVGSVRTVLVRSPSHACPVTAPVLAFMLQPRPTASARLELFFHSASLPESTAPLSWHLRSKDRGRCCRPPSGPRLPLKARDSATPPCTLRKQIGCWTNTDTLCWMLSSLCLGGRMDED